MHPSTATPEDLHLVLDVTRDAWGEMRGGRIFITGGTGFFGRWLLESFVAANEDFGLQAEAVVLTRNADAFKVRAPRLAASQSIVLHEGSLTGFEPPPGSFTHCIHAASELSTANPEDPLGLLLGSISGAMRVAEFAKDRGVRKLLFTSSGAVYGPMVAGRSLLAEDAPISAAALEGRAAYAAAKRAVELALSLFGSTNGLEVKIARGFAFIGPFLDLGSHLAAANFLRAALDGRPLVIEGHGRTVRSYLYGADLAAWLWTILFRGKHARPYNLGSDQAVTIQELAESIALAAPGRPPVVVKGRLADGEIPDVYVPDISRAGNELGLSVFTPLAEAVKKSVAFHTNAS